MNTRIVRWGLVSGATLSLAAVTVAGDATKAAGSGLFEAPVRMTTADGTVIKVEAPGYACPTWHDVDGDGREDLVVGQFAGGKMHFFRGTEDGLAAGTWIMTGDTPAQVPGVW